MASLTSLSHLIPPVATILLSVAISYWLFRWRWDVRGARTFVVLLVVGGIGWQLLTVTHVLASEPGVLAFVVVAEKWVGMVASMVFVVFVSQYTNSSLHRTRLFQGLVTLLLGGFVLLWATNDAHGLLAAGIAPFEDAFVYSSLVRGPLYFLLLGLNYALLTVSYYFVVNYLLTARRGPRLRILLLTLGTLSVGTLNLLSVVDAVPLRGFNYGSYGSLPFILFTTVGIFRLGLLDITPIARKTLVGTLTDPVIVVDEDRRIADFNQAATRLWPDLATAAGEQFAVACPGLADQLDFPTGNETVTDQVSLSGTEDTRYYSVLASPVQQSPSSDVLGYSILVRDVTELETSRRELERQNERLDRVAATLSHDLRNPLNVASGRLDLLRSELDIEDDDRAREHVERLERAHHRMADIVDETLTLAREGQSAGDFDDVDVAAAARDAWANVETGAVDLSVDAEGTIRADRASLLTVFENLFRNAVEHGSTASQQADTADERDSTGRAGTETTETTVVWVDSADGDLVVADDGPGISADERETVFEHGYTTADGGTGFGLTIVETVAENHGWQVALEESADGGARFVFHGARVGADE